MKDENIQNLEKEQPVKSESKGDIQISDVIAWASNHKLFISLSIFICLLLGFFYASHSELVYQRESSVMIRSDSYGNSQISELAAF